MCSNYAVIRKKQKPLIGSQEKNIFKGSKRGEEEQDRLYSAQLEHYTIIFYIALPLLFILSNKK